MKILSITWGLFCDAKKNISRNGGSIAIYNICEYIGKMEESLVFLGNRPIEGEKFGNVRILDNTKYLPKVRSSQNISVWHNALKKSLIEALENEQPDFVFIHGVGDFSENCIRVCIERNQKFAFVDHSYFGSGSEQYGEEMMKEWERRIFSLPDIHVVMVGNGMRNHMLSDYPEFPANRVKTIVNGTNYYYEKKESDIRKKYAGQEKKVLVCVGRIYKRKNQIQLARVFKYLPKEISDNLVILICGKESPNDPGLKDLMDSIIKECVEDKVKYIGEFNEEGMKEIYSAVDGLIMPSISEGLSLVALEMLVYGRPVIMFSDNETAADVCNSDAVVLAEDRDDATLAKAIINWYYKDWNQEKIQEYAKRFSMERVAKDYVTYCSECIAEEA